jgi:hypothetical protein
MFLVRDCTHLILSGLRVVITIFQSIEILDAGVVRVCAAVSSSFDSWVVCMNCLKLLPPMLLREAVVPGHPC